MPRSPTPILPLPRHVAVLHAPPLPTLIAPPPPSHTLPAPLPLSQLLPHEFTMAYSGGVAVVSLGWLRAPQAGRGAGGRGEGQREGGQVASTRYSYKRGGGSSTGGGSSSTRLVFTLVLTLVAGTGTERPRPADRRSKRRRQHCPDGACTRVGSAHLTIRPPARVHRRAGCRCTSPSTRAHRRRRCWRCWPPTPRRPRRTACVA